MVVASLSTSRLLVTYLRPFWLSLLMLFICLLAGIGLDLLSPYLLRLFIDAITTRETLNILSRLALLFLGAAILRQGFSLIETYFATNVEQKAMNRLRYALLQHCLHLDLSFYELHAPGELIERIDGDISALGNMFSRLIVVLLSNALLLIGVLLALFLIDWRVGIIMILFTLILLPIILRSQATNKPRWQAERQASADLYSFIEEQLNGREDICSSGAIAYVMRGLYRHSRNVLSSIRRAYLGAILALESTAFLFTVGTIASLATGVWLFLTHAITLGIVYAIYNYVSLLQRPIEQFTLQIRDVQRALASLERVRDLLNTHSVLDDNKVEKLPTGSLSVELHDVTFQYVTGETALEHVSFVLPPKQLLGVLGRTGSGKTTLAKLLVRLYDPSSGMICLNGVNVHNVSIADLRQRVGIVTQDVHLFHASVRDNLTLFRPDVADERLLQILQEVGLEGWYQSLASGLDTLLSTSESGLSAGEAQMLSFARILLQDPDLVILDEASSRLDPATEHQLEKVMDRLFEGRTGIIIAHRLETIQRANTILILEQGRCCEYGAREELASNPCSRFSQSLRIAQGEIKV